MKFTRRVFARSLLGGAVLALSLAPGVARADSVQVVLDDRPLVFDVPPVIEESVTMVPVRAILTPLGADFVWEQESGTVIVTLEGTEIRAVVGSSTATVNGESVPLAMPVINREGRTLIPLRFFAEELGFLVEWEGESRTVLLTSKNPAAERTPVRTATAAREGSRLSSEQLVSLASQQIGMPYAWGGSSPAEGFDCSGLITFLAVEVGVDLPRTSFDQFTAGVPVEVADLVAGDLVFFTTYEPGASHVGIYDGAGGFIHAQSPEVGVVRTPLSNPWWAERYIGARQVFR